VDDTSGQTRTLNELSASVEIDAEVVEDYGDTTTVFEVLMKQLLLMLFMVNSLQK
jgi:hypothetical protein